MASDRGDFVLGVLSTSNGGQWTPVQVQKIFFVLDKELGERVGGPYWSFSAYDYGPFDSDVYAQLEKLRDAELVTEINGGIRQWRLTESGQAIGVTAFGKIARTERQYIEHLSKWARSLSFQQLVSAIYKKYPDMKANSVFRDPV